jgi:hypothetical protein
LLDQSTLFVYKIVLPGDLSVLIVDLLLLLLDGVDEYGADAVVFDALDPALFVIGHKPGIDLGYILGAKPDVPKSAVLPVKGDRPEFIDE